MPAALCVALMLIAPPALAADEKTLNCVIEHLDTRGVALIEAHFEQLIRATARPLPEPGDDVVDALSFALGFCSGRHGWSERAEEAGLNYSFEKVGRAGAERGITGLGIDPAPIAEFYFGLPITTREIAMPNDPWPGVLDRFSVEAGRRKLFGPANATRVGRYLACLNLADVARADFLRA